MSGRTSSLSSMPYTAMRTLRWGRSRPVARLTGQPLSQVPQVQQRSMPAAEEVDTARHLSQSGSMGAIAGIFVHMLCAKLGLSSVNESVLMICPLASCSRHAPDMLYRSLPGAGGRIHRIAGIRHIPVGTGLLSLLDHQTPRSTCWQTGRLLCFLNIIFRAFDAATMLVDTAVAVNATACPAGGHGFFGVFVYLDMTCRT